MRRPAPTAWKSGREGGALLYVLLAACAALALTLAPREASPGAPGVPASAAHGRLTSEGPRTTQAASPARRGADPSPGVRVWKASIGEWAALVAAAPTHQLHQSLGAARGRTGFPPPDLNVLHRAVRERQEALLLAVAHRMRFSAPPVCGSEVADRPSIVIRPLRGPPARA
ncbi:hypothetical protein P2318_34145 [Myxococcaceae bacterium GXIMD 01537]